ncbi:MAG: GGDEF domain-containing protein [Acholeplasmatales bacterium]|nr:GGDEF domain-containing protein [Acholeplasmatales bacterium]
MTINYVVMLIYSLLIILVILIKAIFEKNLTIYSKRLLLIALISEAIMLTAESLGSLISLGRIIAPNILNAFIQFIFFTAQGITIYITFLLLSEMTGFITREEMKKRNLFCIPETILSILAFISIWTGWMFYIDEKGIYHQGPINFVQYLVVAFYLAFVGLSSFIKLFMRKYFSQRALFISIVCYSLLPLIGTIVEFGVKNATGNRYPFILASIALSTLIIYLQLLQNQVQTDYLTDIPNRAMLMRYIESKMNHENYNLYVFVLDINDFKLINDRFGHLEGDRVLKILSNNLKQFSRETGNFVARYAGDEFVIVADTKKNSIDEINELIHQYIKIANDDINDNRYELSVAVGYVKYDDKIQTIKDFIDLADKEMYKDKQKYHLKLK